MKSSKTNIVHITSGSFRGRKLKVPGAAHPMGARERLALFNSIAGRVPGAKVLDLFAGSGALGVEALSRGAMAATFVEKNARAAAVIRENLTALGIDGMMVLCQSAGEFTSSEKYDVILADPPYDKFDAGELVDASDLLENDGILVLSHPSSFTPEIPKLKHITTHKYANCNISLFTKLQ